MNAVQAWIDDGTIDPEHFNIDEGIDAMPSDVTRDYIYKVVKTYRKYKGLPEFNGGNENE
jgi:soluble lytic murein transglycosylase